MDRTSIEVLKYINENGGTVSADQIAKKYGTKGEQSLSMLCKQEYVSRGIKKTVIYLNAATGNTETKVIPSNMYSIEPLGRDFLEHRFWNLFDKWLGRANGVLSILGGALLSKPLWAILEWFWDKISMFWNWFCGLV